MAIVDTPIADRKKSMSATEWRAPGHERCLAVALNCSQRSVQLIARPSAWTDAITPTTAGLG